MPTTPLPRGSYLPALFLLSAVTATACIPGYRYPEPGEPGPVVTAGGDTIPEGSDRIAFMSGYEAGYERGEEEGGPYGWSTLGVAAGTTVALTTLPFSLHGALAVIPFTVGGIGLVWLSVPAGSIPSLTELPAAVVDQGTLYEAGYREGYVHGLRLERQKATALGVLTGVAIALRLLFYAASR